MNRRDFLSRHPIFVGCGVIMDDPIFGETRGILASIDTRGFVLLRDDNSNELHPFAWITSDGLLRTLRIDESRP